MLTKDGLILVTISTLLNLRLWFVWLTYPPPHPPIKLNKKRVQLMNSYYFVGYDFVVIFLYAYSLLKKKNNKTQYTSCSSYIVTNIYYGSTIVSNVFMLRGCEEAQYKNITLVSSVLRTLLMMSIKSVITGFIY